MYCYNCGNELSDKAVICPNCKTEKNKNPVSSTILLLCVIIPIFGIVFGLTHLRSKYGKTILLIGFVSSIVYSLLCVGLVNFFQENIIDVIKFNY